MAHAGAFLLASMFDTLDQNKVLLPLAAVPLALSLCQCVCMLLLSLSH